MPMADMFWGDRYGVILDPFGHSRSVATHQRDMTPQQVEPAFETMPACSASQGLSERVGGRRTCGPRSLRFCGSPW